MSFQGGILFQRYLYRSLRLEHFLSHPLDVVSGEYIEVLSRSAAADRRTHFVVRDAVKAAFFESPEERFVVNEPLTKLHTWNTRLTSRWQKPK